MADKEDGIAAVEEAPSVEMEAAEGEAPSEGTVAEKDAGEEAGSEEASPNQVVSVMEDEGLEEGGEQVRKRRRSEPVKASDEKQAKLAVPVSASELSSENIVVQKDAQGRVQKMFVKDAQGRIVAELKPFSGGGGGSAAPKPVKDVKLDQKKVTTLTLLRSIAPKPSSSQAKQDDTDKVKLATKLSVAGVKLPPTATSEQVSDALSKAARLKRRSRKGGGGDCEAEETNNRPAVACDVPNCKGPNYDRRLTYFRVPSDMPAAEQRRSWMHAMGKPSLATLPSSGLNQLSLHVCELHFQPECFVVEEENGRKMLKSNAVPTIAVAKVTTLVTVSDKIQEVTVPPAKLEAKDLNVLPLMAFLTSDKSSAGPSTAAYDIPLLEQQIRVHRQSMEKLQKQVGLPAGANADVSIDNDSSVKEIRLKSEILARRKRIRELVGELGEKRKMLKEEEKSKDKATVVGGTAASTAATLLRAMRAPTQIPSNTISRLKEEAASRAREAKKTRDFYVSKTMAALKGERFNPGELAVKDQLSVKLAKVEEYERLKKEATPDCLYLQPTGNVDLPPLILSGNPTEAIKFLKEDKLQAFLRKQARSYAQKIGGGSDSDENPPPRIGFVLTTIEDTNNKDIDLNEIVELPNSAPPPLPVLEKAGSRDPVTSKLASLQPVPQDPQQLLNDKRYDKFLNLNVVYTAPLSGLPGRSTVASDKELRELYRLREAKESLNAKLTSANYEIEYLTSKVRKLEKLLQNKVKSKNSSETTMARLREEVVELRKWKTKFLNKEKLRLKKTKRIMEKRKLRRDYIVKEIEAGRMQKQDLYLIYSKGRLPIDSLENPGDEDDDGNGIEGGYLDGIEIGETAGDIAGMLATRKTILRGKRRPQAAKRPSKYPAVPSNPTSVFTYKLKPNQKVRVPSDHPQLSSIRNKDMVEVMEIYGTHNVVPFEEVVVETNDVKPNDGSSKRRGKGGLGKHGLPSNGGGDDDEDDSEVEGHEQQEIIETQQLEVDQAVEYAQEISSDAGVVTFKYDSGYGNTEFIQLPIATTQTVESASGCPQDQMDYIIRTVDDLEQLKYSDGASGPTYYIHQAPTAANVIQLGEQVEIPNHAEIVRVITTEAQQDEINIEQPQDADEEETQNVITGDPHVQQPQSVIIQRTSPRKRQKYKKYENY